MFLIVGTSVGTLAANSSYGRSVENRTDRNRGSLAKRHMERPRGRRRKSAPAIPKFNVAASCQAAVAASDAMAGNNGRTDNSCLGDENTALTKLKNEWKNFGASQRSLCLTLEQAGGPPSYVEFLTCLEMGQAAAHLPDESQKQTLPRITRRRRTK